MKTPTSIRNTEKYLKIIILIALMFVQVTLRASGVPASKEDSSETEQVVEEWMLNPSNWAKFVEYGSSEESFELETKIEEWMVDPDNEVWGNDEEEPEIEEWMYNINHCTWNECDPEEEYEIEAWMTDPSSWEESDSLLHAEAY